ncbi:STAS domain-containing protein [Planococcus sp. ISL-110]|uniref:STAS domain-containing protein n=1 Tax=Planococcus sp. ISL-110 TaxID=2819167 RepID=UPI0020365B35|nr:STAS domain-containing protein [Planococcus sp. ISL-110]
MESNASNRYTIHGQLFFASSQNFVSAFDKVEAAKGVILNYSDAAVWDDSGIGAIDRVMNKLLKLSV